MTDPAPSPRVGGPAFGSSDALMVAAVVMWGINFSTIKIALRELTPGGFNGMRLFITAAFFVGLVVLSREKFRIERRDILGLAAVGIAGNAVYQILFIHGVSLTTASNTSLILSVSPIFVALLSAVLGIERIHWAAWLGILISFCGLYLVIAAGNGGLRFSAANTKGDLFVFGATILWASYTVFSKPFLERMSPLKFSAYTIWAGALVYLPLTAGDVLAVNWTRVSFRSWAMIVLSSLFGFVIGYLIWYNSVKKVGNSKTAIYNNLTPVFTALFAALILGERFRPRQLIGAAVILMGVYLTRSGYRFFIRRNEPS